MTNRAPLTANDRFKAAWGGHVARCTALAVAAHAALFLGFPALPGPTADAHESRPDLEWVALGAGSAATAASLGGASPAGALARDAGREATDDRIAGPDDADAAGVPATTARTMGADALREYLRRRTAAAGDVVAGAGIGSGGGPTRSGDPVGPGGPLAVEVATERVEAGRRIGGTASTTGEAGSGDGDGLGLGRLSAIQPELAYHAPSPWVLIQNPDEVEHFLKRRFRDDPSNRVRGTVSVALWIDERGTVEWAEINRSSGQAEVDASALELFSRVASFRPARQDGVRVPIAVIFSLTLPL